MEPGPEPSSMIMTILKIYSQGLGISEISRKAHLNRNSVAKYLESLQASGQVDMHKMGVTKIYRVVRESKNSVKLSEEQIKQYQKDFHFICKSASDFINLPKDSNIYDVIGSGVKYLVPDAVIATSVFDRKSSSITVKSFIGDDDDVFKEYFRDMLNLNMPIGDPEVVDLMASGVLHQVPGGVHITTFGQIPVFSSAKIESNLPVQSIWSVGMASCKNLHCVATMFKKDASPPRNKDLVVAYTRLATLGLLKKKC
jgi:predicted transcriptional regulator